MRFPTRPEFLRRIHAFRKHEQRDAMYKVASFLIDHFWGRPVEMVDALGVLLLTWNQAFYRYGSFSYFKLEKCLAKNLAMIETFRGRNLLAVSETDEGPVRHLVLDFLGALQIDSGKARGRKSPVAAAKALHLLAPNFFPLWDYKIARYYRCNYSNDPAGKYLAFCMKMKEFANQVRGYRLSLDRTLVKLLDEYNYAKITKHWR